METLCAAKAHIMKIVLRLWVGGVTLSLTLAKGFMYMADTDFSHIEHSSNWPCDLG